MKNILGVDIMGKRDIYSCITLQKELENTI